MSKISEIKKAYDDYRQAQKTFETKTARIHIGTDEQPDVYKIGYIKYDPDFNNIWIYSARHPDSISFDVQSIPDIIKALQELIE